MKEEQVIDELMKIGEQNGFQTQWSLDTISPIDALYLKWKVVGKFMTNGINNDIKVELPNKNLTGLELWEYADKLYKLIGDTEHSFIEDFKLKGDTIEVFFGS